MRRRTKTESDRLQAVDEWRKRVLQIAAAILAARKLSQYDAGKWFEGAATAIETAAGK